MAYSVTQRASSPPPSRSSSHHQHRGRTARILLSAASTSDTRSKTSSPLRVTRPSKTPTIRHAGVTPVQTLHALANPVLVKQAENPITREGGKTRARRQNALVQENQVEQKPDVRVPVAE